MRYQFLRYPNGLEKAVTLSYDDACKQDVRFAETITRAGLKCTFNVNSHLIAHLTDEQIKESYLDCGHEIAVHGAQHIAEGTMRPIQGIQDVLNCRLSLEKRFDLIIRGMAYPDSGITRFSNGANYESLKHYLADLDIVYARTLGTDNDKFMLPEDWYCWMPTAHHKNPNLMEWIDKFLSIKVSESYPASRYPRLFYLWGHSYEFGDCWELLDKICEKLGGHEDIWYATNMEIYEYVKAYEALVYSADGTKIYNPTLVDLWINRDGVTTKVASGKTVRF
jgi:peptidoglycan/xylan/chitin deacetylase (PgdA/CDA1 family)